MRSTNHPSCSPGRWWWCDDEERGGGEWIERGIENQKEKNEKLNLKEYDEKGEKEKKNFSNQMKIHTLLN